MKTCKRLEHLLEDIPSDIDLLDYYATPDQLLEPLILCYDSLVKKGILIPFQLSFLYDYSLMSNFARMPTKPCSNHVALVSLLMADLPTSSEGSLPLGWY